MDPREARLPLPEDQQTGLPRSIFYQPEEIGGSLGFGLPPALEDVWDKLEADAAADVLEPGAGANLRQSLNDFIFQAEVTSELVIPYNRDRVYLFMQNQGAADVFASFGHSASIVPGQSHRISAGGFLEPILGTISSVHMIAAAGVQPVNIIEGFRA